MLDQIGPMTIMGISGGRVSFTAVGLDLPVTNEIAVRIILTPWDVYTVQRLRRDGDEARVAGERTDVYCDQLSEVAWRCSCWESYSDEEW